METSLLVAAMRSKVGASAAILYRFETAEFQPVSSPALFLEYEAVLKRQDHGLQLEEVNGLLDALAAWIEPVEIRFVWRPLLNDAGDEMVLEAAIHGFADAIVTHNRRDFEPAAHRFGIEVLSPAQLLQSLRKKR